MQENMDNATQPASDESKLDAVASKYTDQFDRFSKSKSGNALVEFLMFRRNIVPLTLSILFAGGVLVFWLIGIAGLVGKGPIGEMFQDLVHVEKTINGKVAMVDELRTNYVASILVSLVVIVLAPFVIHYILELAKYVWAKIIVPLWDKVVIRFFVNVMPELFPFMFERFMKFVDIILDGLITVIMTVTAVVKGVVLIPKTLCQRVSKWLAKPLEGTATAK